MPQSDTEFSGEVAGLKFHIRTKPYKALFEDIRKGNKIPTNLEFDLKMNDTEISVETEIEISSADFKDKKDIRVCARLIWDQSLVGLAG